MAAAWRYRGFISYSQKDKAEARRLHRWLESYRLPSGTSLGADGARRLGRFFHDDEEMPAAADIAATVRGAIEDSESLIVLCSPRAAHSKWVNAEIEHFRSTGRADKVFAVIIDGAPNSGNPETECFPPALRVGADPRAMPIEPLGLDLRKEGRARACARLAAGLLGFEFDQLWKREQRRRRAHILQAAIIGGLALLGLISVTVFGFELQREWVRQTQILPHVLSLRQAASLNPGSSFRECASAFTCPEMIVVHESEFAMGSPADNRRHRRQISVPRFAVGKFDITHDDWDECVKYTKQSTLVAAARAHRRRVGCAPVSDGGFGKGRRPVVLVSWDEAQGYIAWLNALTMGSPDGPYRLLSEAEWEYAARGGVRTTFFWGNARADACVYANGLTQATKQKYPGFAQRAAPCEDSYVETSPVGAFRPNAFGLYDMAGNVWQWVQDCYSEYDPTKTDALPEDGICSRRVLRGGSWADGPEGLGLAMRGADTPSDRASVIGFRVARTLSSRMAWANASTSSSQSAPHLTLLASPHDARMHPAAPLHNEGIFVIAPTPVQKWSWFPAAPL